MLDFEVGAREPLDEVGHLPDVHAFLLVGLPPFLHLLRLDVVLVRLGLLDEHRPVQKEHEAVFEHADEKEDAQEPAGQHVAVGFQHGRRFPFVQDLDQGRPEGGKENQIGNKDAEQPEADRQIDERSLLFYEAFDGNDVENEHHHGQGAEKHQVHPQGPENLDEIPADHPVQFQATCAHQNQKQDGLGGLGQLAN